MRYIPSQRTNTVLQVVFPDTAFSWKPAQDPQDAQEDAQGCCSASVFEHEVKQSMRWPQADAQGSSIPLPHFVEVQETVQKDIFLPGQWACRTV